MNVIRYIHEWTCENSNIVFLTFPMIHIGNEDFYNTISNEIKDLNCVLIEGVSIIKSELGTYSKLAEHFDLSTQTESLKIPPDITIQNIDIEPKVFKQGIKDLHFIDKCRMIFIFIFLNFPFLLNKDKTFTVLKKMFYYTSQEEHIMKNPLNHYAFNHKEKSAIELLIQNTRDATINRNLESVIKENSNRKYRYDVGILFGDAHMPFIYKTLNKNKFKWKLYKEVVVM